MACNSVESSAFCPFLQVLQEPVISKVRFSQCQTALILILITHLSRKAHSLLMVSIPWIVVYRSVSGIRWDYLPFWSLWRITKECLEVFVVHIWDVGTNNGFILMWLGNKRLWLRGPEHCFPSCLVNRLYCNCFKSSFKYLLSDVSVQMKKPCCSYQFTLFKTWTGWNNIISERTDWRLSVSTTTIQLLSVGFFLWDLVWCEIMECEEICES